MTFRTRLVLATTVAVVVAVLVASTASFLAARNSLLGAADNSLTAAAKKITAGQQISATTATLGQVIDSAGAVVSGGALPVTPQVRLVAAGLAPAFFTTVTVGGDQLREFVEPLPAGTAVANGDPGRGRSAADRHAAQRRVRAGSPGDRPGAVALTGVLLAVVLGWLVAQTALVPLNALTATVEDLAETTDVTRRLSPGGPDELGRLRRTFNRLLEALEFSRRAQSQLVLDASHELRTPLTSLRTNLEVIRRVDELSEADRSVLVDDVLVQLQELTDLVGDLAELARGDQMPVRKEPLRLDLLVQRCGRRGRHARADPGRDLRPGRGGVLGLGRRGPPVPCRRQPARQRPQMEPARRGGLGLVRRRRRRGAGTAVRASPRKISPISSIASTGPRPPAACPARAWGWPSWPRSSRRRAAPSGPRSIPGAAPACRCSCPPSIPPPTPADPKRHRSLLRRDAPLPPPRPDGSGVDQLHAVPERVVDVTPLARWAVRVRAHLDRRLRQRSGELSQVPDQQGRMRLLGRAEVVLDAQMQRHRARDEPASTPAGLGLRLGEAGQSQEPGVEGLRRRLATRGAWPAARGRGR